MKEGKPIFTYPKPAVLQPHIKLYSWMSAHEPDFEEHITYYPNFTSTINVYKNTAIEYDDVRRTHRPSTVENFKILFVGKFNRSREIHTFGPYQKLTIVFHPLGLNHFVGYPLGPLIQEHFSFFEHYGETLDLLLPELFSNPDLGARSQILDNFFLSHYEEFKEERLKQAVELILAAEDTLKVQDIADQLQISRKTLLRLFRKHLSYSVEEYISVVKFRKTMINYQSKSGKRNLSQIALEGNYYDQSDFYKNYKLKCGQTPSQLFKELKTIEAGLFWKMS
ncbi:MAG: helix-turn-helix transcriptional regulator [Saprospiraceae bacterium]|nr:helix-turn-helix transcriptional regulator [Saprospiraceae bacterium]